MSSRLAAMACVGWLCCLGVGAVSSPPAAQAVFKGEGSPDDSVTRGILAGAPVPRTIHDIRKRLQQHGGVLRTHIVANGGHEHPRTTDRKVAFMAFETYEGPIPGGRVDEGDLFFGYFLTPRNRTLSVADGFVELIAWDQRKQVFNFWELIGSDWFYRGDSKDVLDNGVKLGLGDPAAQFVFTRTASDAEPVLRCSGCHTLGAPIMKELAAPHNDWWRDGPGLSLDGLQADPTAAKLFSNATDASNLARQVRRGIDRLIAGSGAVASLRLRLRSLFSTMEMNLESDSTPFQERVKAGSPIQIPTAFFVDRRLATGRADVVVDLVPYRRALADTDSRFPPGAGPDSRETRHAFLTPARSLIDNRVIDRLLVDGLLDEELVADVLAIDMTAPVYSKVRASLIKYVPDAATDVRELRHRLMAALQKAPKDDEAARELLANIIDPARTADAHRRRAATYLEACRAGARSSDAVAGWLRYANQKREAINNADTGSHHAGRITEEGFREIFPQQAGSSQPLRLNQASCLADPR